MEVYLNVSKRQRRFMSLHNETTDAPSNRLKLVDNALWINFGIIE